MFLIDDSKKKTGIKKYRFSCGDFWGFTVVLGHADNRFDTPLLK